MQLSDKSTNCVAATGAYGGWGCGDYDNWMVVDAVKNMDDGKPAEVDREDGLWMMFFCLAEDDDAVARREHELCGSHWSV